MLHLAPSGQRFHLDDEVVAWWRRKLTLPPKFVAITVTTFRLSLEAAQSLRVQKRSVGKILRAWPPFHRESAPFSRWHMFCSVFEAQYAERVGARLRIKKSN